jgi:hypothetical protein
MSIIVNSGYQFSIVQMAAAHFYRIRPGATALAAFEASDLTSGYRKSGFGTGTRA